MSRAAGCSFAVLLRVRRRLAVALWAACLLVILSACASGPAPLRGQDVATVRCPLNVKLVPSCGVLWGAYAASRPGQGWVTPFTSLERVMGRRFDVVKRYHDFSGLGDNGQFPDPAERRLGANRARILYLAWSSSLYAAHSHVLWSDIAAGRYDASVIRPEAQRIRQWRLPVFMDFDHEMDSADKSDRGTMAQYVRAYRHIHDVFAALHVNNVVWVWVSTGWTGASAQIGAAYPGDAYVDWIGYDPYNFYLCHQTSWQSVAATLTPFYNWLLRHRHANKPWMLAEYGTRSGRYAWQEPRWYYDLPAALRRLPRIRAVVQWDDLLSPACDFRIDVRRAVLLAFAAASRSRAVRG